MLFVLLWIAELYILIYKVILEYNKYPYQHASISGFSVLIISLLLPPSEYEMFCLLCFSISVAMAISPPPSPLPSSSAFSPPSTPSPSSKVELCPFNFHHLFHSFPPPLSPLATAYLFSVSTTPCCLMFAHLLCF